jgi:iron(III) transport system substrate-binding protein
VTRRPHRPLVALTAIALAGTALSGCSALGGSATSSATSGAGQTITLYNGQHEQTTDALVAAFEKQTGTKVLVRSDDEDVFANQIEQEGAKSPADVFYTENSPALMQLENKGLLAPAPAAALAEVPGKYDSPDGDWVGISARVSVMIYNTKLLKASQLPTSVTQLADPQWAGKLAIAEGETDFQPIVTSMLKAYGLAATTTWLDGLKSNAANHVYPDNETITSMVDSGQAAIGIINQYYWYRQGVLDGGMSKMHSAIAYFAPHDPGYVLNVSGAAVLASSKHKAAAGEFLQFLASAKGQEIIAKGDSYEYPIGSGVTTAEPETPFDQLQPIDLTIPELGDGGAAISLLQQAQML